MSSNSGVTVPAKRGRPSTGARERIRAAATETMKAEGYAGLTVAKVAARAGESKALIGYHFGSKQGLVAAVGRELAETITTRVLAKIEDTETVEDLTRGIAVAIEEIADEDPRIPRLYFDLAAVSVVDPDVRGTIQEINGVWREVVHERLEAASDGPKPRDLPALALLIMTGVQGMALERVEREPGPELKQAREMFVRSVAHAARG
ncbi:MAG: TetR/AcrR family transcriptional regulator [Actinomycetota bacterium]|nr:TetR/AcrR family transcriptional regulator [Actinomycetota bacterium]